MRFCVSRKGLRPSVTLFFFFFNDTATTEIYTLSLHDALPISHPRGRLHQPRGAVRRRGSVGRCVRSEEHTSELQSPCNLVCRLLLEKKKDQRTPYRHQISDYFIALVWTYRILTQLHARSQRCT